MATKTLTPAEEQDLKAKLVEQAAAAAVPPDDEDDQDDGDDPDKKGKSAPPVPVAAAPAGKGKKAAADKLPDQHESGKDLKDDEDSDDEPKKDAVGELKQIVALCAVAGKPELANKFIKKGLTLAQAIDRMADIRAAEPANQAQLSTSHDTASGIMALPALDNIERATRTVMTSYGMTRPKAMAEALRLNDNLYRAYIDEREDALSTRKTKQAYQSALIRRLGGTINLSANTGDATRQG